MTTNNETQTEGRLGVGDIIFGKFNFILSVQLVLSLTLNKNSS